MKKYIVIILMVSLLTLISASEIQISNQGIESNRIMNLDIPVPPVETGVTSGTANSTYLKLDATNSPITGDLLISNSFGIQFNDSKNIIFYNETNGTIWLIANNILQQTWGSSTNILTNVTLSSDLTVEGEIVGSVGNITDGDLNVGDGSIIVDGNITVGTQLNLGNDTKVCLGDVCQVFMMYNSTGGYGVLG